ncbi:MAG: sensor histidine kinase [Phycisphaerae bacterium]
MPFATPTRRRTRDIQPTETTQPVPSPTQATDGQKLADGGYAVRAFGARDAESTAVVDSLRNLGTRDGANGTNGNAPTNGLSNAVGHEHAAQELQQIKSYVKVLEQRLASLYGQVRQARQLSSMATVAPTIAHEVNNLLTPMIGYVDSAMRSENADLQKKALGVAWRNSQMLVAMADRILQIGAADAFEVEDVVVRNVAEDAVSSLCRDLSKDGITFANEVDADCVVRADRLSLQQVFFNIFLNARDAMAKQHGGRLKVITEPVGDMVTIRIADTGPGIQPDVLARIFEPLHSSKTDDRSGRCRGLGLPLCKNLVAEMQGTIGAESEPGRGTTFMIKLPLIRTASAATKMEAATVSTGTGPFDTKLPETTPSDTKRTDSVQ